jgi:hypothetical protein
VEGHPLANFQEGQSRLISHHGLDLAIGPSLHHKKLNQKSRSKVLKSKVAKRNAVACRVSCGLKQHCVGRVVIQFL